MSPDDKSEFQTFIEWCLWDTGVQISYILSSRLNPGVKSGPKSPKKGFISGDIMYVYLNFEF